MRGARVGKAVAALAAGAGLVLLTVPSAGAAEAAAPAISVSPASGLSNGQAVTVTGTGFPAGAQVGASECSNGTWPDVRCDSADGVSATADASGGFSVTLTVRTAFQGAGQPAGPVDCLSAPGCAVRAGDTTGAVVAAPVALAFS
ncbi:enediyne antibiotic chromoprotein [Amycolatopsis sp. H20-H5]|uniref:enediyne antibiotic chromoprotein n=1 Tax=Amycolatopsis sp. H20-H5 TaxID=3046309 RepID=UPI002DBFDA0C|nr:enediyne antibiotic chromoprotein [Amycolatopsis sp. H20-H5]